MVNQDKYHSHNPVKDNDSSDGKTKNNVITINIRPIVIIISIFLLITMPFSNSRTENEIIDKPINTQHKNEQHQLRLIKKSKEYSDTNKDSNQHANTATTTNWIPETYKYSYNNTPYECSSYDSISEKYHEAINTASDINQHLPMLRILGASVSSILEFGVRSVTSSWAFAMGGIDRSRQGLRLKYTSGDITRKPAVDLLETLVTSCEAIEFEFIEGDDLLIPEINAELIFIDTWHVYRQLFAELQRYSNLASKYLVLHDTTLFGYQDEGIEGHGDKAEDPNLYNGIKRTVGLWPAVEDFLKLHEDEWRVLVRAENNNGLTVLIRNGGAG